MAKANTKVFVATILLFTLVVVHGVKVIEVMSNDGGSGSGSANSTKMECGGACAERCQKSKRPNLCKRACSSCCRVCDCVPSGTSGNYEECPCYAKLTTRDNKLKCP